LSRETQTAVILARGLGKRMRRDDSTTTLDAAQARAASAGMKGMIPIRRPFLEYIMSALADAGYKRVCLVVGPEHGEVQEHFTNGVNPTRIEIDFAIQREPKGTADAVLAAEECVGDQNFVVLNSDNYYPPTALSLLRGATAPAIVGFARSGLLRSGNVPPERVERFGALDFDSSGFLTSIFPRAGSNPAEHDGEIYSSMNCWLFTPRIFDACRKIELSARGELELPQAVQLAIDTMGMKMRVIRVNEPVLDLSTREDVSQVQSLLEAVTPRL
jgi:glucose-1-phosphate thymidylyltransferase